MPPTPPTPRVQNQPVSPTPRIDELDTVEMDQSGLGTAGLAAGAAAASVLAAHGIESDDDALAPPVPPQGGPVVPVAQGSVTPTGPALGPGRVEPASKPPQVNRHEPKAIAMPSATPGKLPTVQGPTPRSTGKLAPQGAQTRGSGKLPTAQGPQNPPADKSGGSGAVATVAAGTALGAPVLAANAGSAGGAPAAISANAGRAGGGGMGPSGLTRQQPPQRSQRTRRSARRRLLLALLFLLTLALIGGIYVEARGGFSSVFGITATVTITPASKLEQDNYVLQALPNSTPNPAQRQIPARVLTLTSATSSATANATGSIEATQAKGFLTFINTNNFAVTLAPTPIPGSDGVEVSIYQNVVVPAAPSFTATVPAFAVNAGTGGNIKAFDISRPCCTTGITVKNTAAFTGGQNAVIDSVIQQGDIDGAAQPLINSLMQSTGSALQKQVASTERVVDGTFGCPATTTANHKAGDVAKTVTVQVSVKCTEEVYDFAAAQQMGVSLLQARAQSDPTLGSGYRLDGQIVAAVISATVVRAASEQVVVEVQAQGRWVYQFSSQLQQTIKQSLVRLTKTSALNKLQSDAGVGSAKITISSGTIMPTSASSITLTIVSLPGVQNTPTGTQGSPAVPTGSPTVLPPGLTPGITPTRNLGGS